MDSFATTLKRRTTDLLSSLPAHLPSNLPSLPSIKLPHHALKGTWERIAVPPLPRSSHSLDIVAGTAYIFGGEAQSAREPVDNAVHAVVLPFSSAPADYYAIAARPAAATTAARDNAEKIGVVGGGLARTETNQSMDEIPLSPEETRAAAAALDQKKEEDTSSVPRPRIGHATAVIGSRIFLFGGRAGVSTGEVLDERGRVWVFDTKTHVWSYLDPVSPADESVDPDGEKRAFYPAARSYHSAVGVAKPDTFSAGPKQSAAAAPPGFKPLRRAETWKDKAASKAEEWRDWALGDSDEVGIPQRPIVGHVAATATDLDEEGFGTLIIHGGCLAGGERTGDVWAFDVRSRVWQELPPAPGNPRGGAALCVSKSRLYRFGGYNGQGEEGGQLDVLDLVVDTFDDQVTGGGEEVTLTARGAWRSLVQDSGLEYTSGHDASTVPLATEQAPGDEWPGPRSVASFEALTVGGGREYLVLMLGERGPSAAGHAGAGAFWDDVWVFQVPPLGMTPASLTDAVLHAVGKKSGEGKWTRVETGPYEEEYESSVEGPGPRGWIASAPMGELEENGIVVWGGLNEENERLGDGWIFRLG